MTISGKHLQNTAEEPQESTRYPSAVVVTDTRGLWRPCSLVSPSSLVISTSGQRVGHTLEERRTRQRRKIEGRRLTSGTAHPWPCGRAQAV